MKKAKKIAALGGVVFALLGGCGGRLDAQASADLDRAIAARSCGMDFGVSPLARQNSGVRRAEAATNAAFRGHMCALAARLAAAR